MDSLTFTFRTTEEADRCDQTRLGNVAAASDDGLTVKIEDFDLDEWTTETRLINDRDTPIPAIRAAMAACGVWVEVEAAGG